MEGIFRKKNRPCKTPYSKQPAATAHPLSKAMVLGSVLLVCSAFILLKSHSVTGLLLGTFGLALLIAGAARQQVAPLPVPPAISVKKNCPYCGLITKPGWRFCPYCTKEIV
jgi:hypothetical protein